MIVAYTKPEWKFWHLLLVNDKIVCQPNTYKKVDSGSNVRMVCLNRHSNRWFTWGWRISKNNVKVVKGRKGTYTLAATNFATHRIIQTVRSNHRTRIIVKKIV